MTLDDVSPAAVRRFLTLAYFAATERSNPAPSLMRGVDRHRNPGAVPVDGELTPFAVAFLATKTFGELYARATSDKVR
jgi:hypothetical protein